MKKTKTLVVALLAGFVLNQSAYCQTNTTDANPAASGGTNNNTATTSPAMAGGGSQAATTSPAMAVASNNPVMAPTSESNAPAAMADTNQPASTVATNAGPATAEAGTNAPAPAAGGEIPISFQDVPITTAIESLARLAGINYLLDPKIGYGQPDQNGQIKPEPTLTIRWENVTAEKALLALLDNYNLQLVENPKTGIYKITTKEPNALPPLMTRVIQLKYASASNMTAAVQSVLTDPKRSRVLADTRTSQLVVVATEKEQADVDTLINQLDKPTRQVLIETKLVELSSNPSTSKGIDWSGTLAAQNFSFGNGVLNTPVITPSLSSTTIPGVPTPGFGGIPTTTSSTTGTTLNSEPQNSLSPGGMSFNTASGFSPAIGFLSADGVKAVLSFLNKSAEAQVVSTPRVVTLDNETATITVTRAFPILNVTAGTVQTAGGSSVTYSNLGTILQVTPRISANDYIWLKVNPSVSSFFGKDTETINGQPNTADIFDVRSIDTQVLIPNAHTLVMGGLVKDNPNATYTKVPFLGDIPILGLAFRSEGKSMEKDNLLIFITPTIIKEADFKPATSDFLNSQPITMKDPMNMHTKWDSAEPGGDWSNPVQQSIDQTHGQDEGKAAVAP